MYNEFKTIEGKVLLNVTNFTWGNIMLSKDNLTNVLISITKEEAEYLNNQYNIEIEEAKQSEDNPEEAIAVITQKYKQELLNKGYVLGKDIEVIIHE